MSQPNLQKQYTLARNELHFAEHRTGSRLAAGFRYIGNTPEFALGSEPEMLDHYDADHGLRVKDDSVTLELSRTGNFTTDNINTENLSAYLLATSQFVTQTPASDQNFTLDDVEPTLTYQIGASTALPTGVRSLSAVVVTNDATPTPATYVANVDYILDAELGQITIVAGGAIVGGTNLKIKATLAAVTLERITSSTNVAIEGALMVKSFNAKGAQRDWFFPYVKLTPNGEINLKGDEWQTVPFSMEVLDPGDGRASVYVDGRPTAVV